MKSLPWFRMYHEALDDEKLRLLAFEDRWHFVALLCCKAKGILDEGSPDLIRRKVAVKLGLALRELDEVARRLAEVDLIHADTLQPMSWESRQMHSDKDETNAQRQARYRESKKQPVTDSNALRNGPVTGIDTEEDTDKEEDKDIVVFEQAWVAYPDRPGKSKASSLKAWNARLKTGCTADEMLQGVIAYAAHCKAQRTEPGYIKQPETFFGPGLHFRSSWKTAPNKHQVPNIQPGDLRDIPDED